MFRAEHGWRSLPGSAGAPSRAWIALRAHTDPPPHATRRVGIDRHRRRSPQREFAAGSGGPAWLEPGWRWGGTEDAHPGVAAASRGLLPPRPAVGCRPPMASLHDCGPPAVQCISPHCRCNVLQCNDATMQRLPPLSPPPRPAAPTPPGIELGSPNRPGWEPGRVRQFATLTGEWPTICADPPSSEFRPAGRGHSNGRTKRSNGPLHERPGCPHGGTGLRRPQ
jgi:hypothetical protein